MGVVEGTGPTGNNPPMSVPGVAAGLGPVEQVGGSAGTWDRMERVAVPVAVVIAIVGVLVATSRFGMGLTSDSVVYLNGARALAAGRGFTDPFGGAIDLFAPGYPAVLAAGHELGLGILDGARWLGALSYGLTVVLAWVLLRRHVRSAGVRTAATLLVGFSAVLLDTYSKLLSEHLFIPLVLVFVIACEELLVRPRAWGWLATAALLVWAAFYLRYVGLVLVGVGGLVIVIGGWASGRVRALLRAAIFGVVAIGVPALWALRNRDATGHAFGDLGPSSTSLVTNVHRVADEVSEWFATRLVPSPLRIVVLAAVVVALVASAIWLRRRRTGMPSDGRALVPLVLLTVVYVGYLIGSATVVAVTNSSAQLGTRFVAPVFVPLVVLGAWLFERVRAALPTPRWRTVVTVLAVVWIGANALWFAGRAVGLARTGAGGYATATFRDSPLLPLVDRLDLSVPTYSNEQYGISAILDKNVRASVAARYFHSTAPTGQLRGFLKSVACDGHARLIWFEPNTHGNLYTPGELARHLIVTPVARTSGGAIYDLRPRPGVTPRCTT